MAATESPSLKSQIPDYIWEGQRDYNKLKRALVIKAFN
jgi:hypothetical protein